MSTENESGSSLGYLETDGPDGRKRLYVAAIFGDGGLIIAHGDWGEFGMVQILASSRTNEMGPALSKDEAIQSIAPDPGVMLLFKAKADVERLIDTLQGVLAVFPTPKEGQP